MKRRPVSDALVSLIGLALVLLLGSLLAYSGLIPMSYGVRLTVTNIVAALILGVIGFAYWKVLWPKQ